MKNLLLLTFFSAFFFACKKDDAAPATGSILYVNQSSTDTYNIYLEGGNYGQVDPSTSKIFSNIAADSHDVKAVQANNYIQKPNSKENTILVIKGDTTVFTFP